MKRFGSYLLFIGIGSMILAFTGYEFRVLMWIENWGTTTGWLIRGGIALLGGVMWMFGGDKDKEEAPATEEQSTAD